MTTSQFSDSSNPLIGGWKLLDAYLLKDNGEKEPIFPGLRGHILFLSDRMFCFTARNGADGTPDGVLLVYAGACKMTEDHFATTVDLTSIDGFLGTTQKRFFEIRGDILDIRAAGPDGKPMQSHLIWQRAK